MNKKLLLGVIFSGLLFTSCSPESTSLYLPGVQKLDQQVEDPNAVYFDPRVDILFVVDNSGSMSGHQNNLIRNVDLFTNAFLQNKILDYNIGVLTTSMCDGFGGGGSRYCGGELVANGGYRYVNRQTPNASFVLKANLDLGTDGSATEMVFDPVYLALTQHLNSINKGFYRDTATLVVIFVTDAEDQSRRNNSLTMKSFLLGLKNNDAKKIITLGVVVPSSVNDRTCARDAYEKPVDIENLLAIFPLPNQSNVLSLCSTTYGAELSKMASIIVNEIGKVISLSRAPIFESIRVTYGNADLPMDFKKGWSFNAKRNEIILGDEIDWSSQPVGSRVKVFYNAAKYDLK
jgi:hypothetical protein